MQTLAERFVPSSCPATAAADADSLPEVPSEELTTLTSTAERRYVAEELGEEDEEMTIDTLDGWSAVCGPRRRRRGRWKLVE